MMNTTETISVNLEGLNYDFKISVEKTDYQYVKAHIVVTTNQASFRRVENSSSVITKVLYHYLFEKLNKYFILKTANIQEENEFQGVFEIADILNFKTAMNRKIRINDETDEIEISIIEQSSFTQCVNQNFNPFNNVETFERPEHEIFHYRIFNCVINENHQNLLNFQNSGESVISKCLDQLFEEKFGKAFYADLIAQRICSHFEIQNKYRFLPSVFK